MANKWNNLKSRMSPDSQARVNARVSHTLAAMRLTDIRKAVEMTQADLADKLDQSQGSVSKMENAADMYLSTLRKYVEALGGKLHLTVELADGRELEIERLGDTTAA